MDRNPLKDLAGLSEEEIDYAESSNYQQSSEGASDSGSGDEDYQPGGMISRNRNHVKYGPSHNAGRPVAGASRQKASSRKNTSQKTSNQYVVSKNNVGRPAIAQNTASYNSQADEEEIILSRDHPQEERCLPYRTTSRMSKRQIISWDANIYTLSLLSLIWILEVKDYPIPWQELAAIVNPGATGEAFKQAMVKLRNRRIADGQRVPPAKPSNKHPRNVCQMELVEMMRNAGMPTGPFVVTDGHQDLQVVEDSSIAERRAAVPVFEAPSVARRSARAENGNSEVDVQRSNGDIPRTTTQQSQCVTQSEPRAARREDPDLAVIHPRSLTSRHQESRAAPGKSHKPSLIFIADIGAQKALLNFNKKEQKLISDVTQNLTNGHFVRAPPDAVFFLDGITALSHTNGNTPSPYNSDESDTEYHISCMERKQKRKRDSASSSPKLTGVVRRADNDIRASHSKKVKNGKGENSPSYWRGDELGGSKKRKHDDADMGGLSPGTVDYWMFNPDYALPAGESIPLGSFIKTDLAWTHPNLHIPFLNSPTRHADLYSYHDLNLEFSASSSLYPRGRTGGSLSNSTDMLNTNQQTLPIDNAAMNMDIGMGTNMGTSMSSVGVNYSEQMPFNQQTNWSQSFDDPFMSAGAGNFDSALDDPFMGGGPGTLDYGLGDLFTGTSSHRSKYSLGGMTSDKEKDLLSSTSQWQSPGHNIFESQAERRLSGLPPVPGDSDYGRNMEPQSSLDMEHHRHQSRGMLNDESIEQVHFDPNDFANEAFSRMDTLPPPNSEEDGL